MTEASAAKLILLLRLVYSSQTLPLRRNSESAKSVGYYHPVPFLPAQYSELVPYHQ